jgi:hypothetical protein
MPAIGGRLGLLSPLQVWSRGLGLHFNSCRPQEEREGAWAGCALGSPSYLETN